LALTRVHARIAFLDLFRSPGYVVPTVLFPAMFFVLFDLPYARAHAAVADFLMLSFMAWAVIGVCLYQFGVGIAQERGRPWERYLRTLPAGVPVRFGARILTALAFGVMAALCVATVACIFSHVDLGVVAWLRVLASMLLGGVPFVLIGITIGYWASARAAIPIATALNLLLAYAGGLWMPPSDLPGFVQQISPYLPTRMFAELLWSVPHDGDALQPIIGLAIYAAIFGALAVMGYRRDERKRYA
ncbi:MAG: ABC transporter permease, partial [Candidatus Eremiobacteraeota bacterium]|nr:ABC transporter permease [Candidatus Eremiobacteraeota bacterium]